MSSYGLATPLPSGRGAVRIRVVNAAEVVAALEAVPGVRRAPAKAPLSAAVLVGGVEVAAIPTTDERALRRAWRERHGGGALPLLLVGDEPSRAGSVRVLGPADGTGPLRSIPATALRDALGRVAPM